MAKRKLLARVKYNLNYNGREGYAVEINTEGEWGLDSFYPTVARKGDTEPNYVHWSILRKLNEIQKLGYDLTIDC